MTILNLFQLCCIIVLLIGNIYYCKLYIHVHKNVDDDRVEALMLYVLFGTMHLLPLMLLFTTIGWFNDSMNIVINIKQHWDAFINFKIV